MSIKNLANLPIGRVFGYIRVSTAMQRDNGDSPETQFKKIEADYKGRWEDKGYTWGGVVQDAASARKTQFFDRDGGGKLQQIMKRGDVIILSRLDRCFRSTKDAFVTMDYWTKVGITPVVLNMNLDLSTAIGQAMFGFMATMCQFESGMISERVRDQQQSLKAEGFYPHAIPPLLYIRREVWIDVNERKKRRRFVLEYDQVQRKYARYCIELAKRLGSGSKTFSFLHQARINFPWIGCPPTLQVVNRLIKEELKIQAVEARSDSICDYSLPSVVRWPVWINPYRWQVGPEVSTIQKSEIA